MLDEDPLWLGPGAELPYALSTDSPCIDAGTLELPPGIELPEYDLAGNPRIVNGIIDMGAYEYQDSVSVLDNIQSSILNIQLSNYPNPFNPTTTIKLDHAESGKIELAIYNIKGQKIKTLMDAYSCKGHFEIIWRGTDENEKKVATGNYFAKLKVNGDIKAVRKLILLK
ncbi:MAG: T9SS type A sorting domain-containing protein [Armatimonadetes bacterium]|nr:T9SS type A sorting domain-containing protein [Armatimonadota bacterium]